MTVMPITIDEKETYDFTISVKVTEATYNEILFLANTYEKSISDIVRTAINRQLKNLMSH